VTCPVKLTVERKLQGQGLATTTATSCCGDMEKCLPWRAEQEIDGSHHLSVLCHLSRLLIMCTASGSVKHDRTGLREITNIICRATILIEAPPMSFMFVRPILI
jgi:hypothetical protein